MPKVHYTVVGAGKVGRALYRALRTKRINAHIMPYRQLSGKKTISSTVLVLAVRDGQLADAAKIIAANFTGLSNTVIVHCAGAMGASALSVLANQCAGIGQMHPLISFADADNPPKLQGAHMQLSGEPEAIRRAAKLAKSIGMVPRALPIAPSDYHACAGLVANGTVALAALGADFLVASGVPKHIVPKMLGPLLRSVADNIEQLGLPEALTGPVRRGDEKTIATHLQRFESHSAELKSLYLALVQAQMPLAARLGDCSEDSLKALVDLVAAQTK